MQDRPFMLLLQGKGRRFYGTDKCRAIEKLLLAFQPTMLFVEHDVRFKETIATGVLHMERN